MNYRFQNLLGAPYRGGNAVISGNNRLISPVGNRIAITDLFKSETITLPCQSSANITRISVSPDGNFILAVDENSRAQYINIHRRIVLHRITFKGKVSNLQFSPNGQFIAVAIGKLIQIWRSPGFRKEFFPFELVRTFADFDDRVNCLNWGPDSSYLIAGSRDLTVRLFCLKRLSDGGDKSNKPFLFLGHRDVIVGVFFGVDKKTGRVSRVYSVSRDGGLFSWGYPEFDGVRVRDEEMIDSPPSPGTPEKMDEDGGVGVGGDGDGDGDGENVKKRKEFDGKGRDFEDEESEVFLHKMKWELLKKDYFMQAPAKVVTCDYHQGLELVVVGFSSGVFGLYQMPDFVCIHLLSISREKITTAVFNELGNWLTFGCAKLGQLLVWEWKSESYILRQQGHYFDVNCLAYSPDSQLLATGADDNKIKVRKLAFSHSPSLFIGFLLLLISSHLIAS